MKKIISLVLCIFVLTISLSLPVGAYFSSDHTYRYFVAKYGSENPYSFVTAEGKIDVLKYHETDIVDMMYYLNEYYQPSDFLSYKENDIFNADFPTHDSHGKEYGFDTLSLYYKVDENGKLESSDFPELTGWSKFKHGEQTERGVTHCSFFWEKQMSAEEIQVYMDALSPRLDSDLVWIEPGVSGLVYVIEDEPVTVYADKLGDLDCDYSINLKDVTMLIQYLAGWDVETNGNADFYYDGKVNMIDAVYMIRYTAGLI